ncbi:replication factor C subunit 4 [Bacillus rossius redtenbacheri]|uniref:replication factor C subunit 4 n=1 Tax=Bacillus rossius redtenbacheri TaxID=93214 RepID=UPI002FDD7D9D
MQSFLKTGKLGPQDKSGTSASNQKKKTSVCTPWVEKYRPRTVSAVVEQADVVEVLRQCLGGADLPNLLFYGPPGTGKTSTILAAARQLFGDMYKDRILELNASDERGIQVIRDKVKKFSQLTASSVRPDGRPCPPFKVVVLDEADSMTHAAQAALRRTMEKESRSTRFCLICNYVSRIIQPLTSRCTKFRFKPLGEGRVLERLELICREEGVSCDRDVLQLLARSSGGDLRRAITCLQSCAKLTGEGARISTADVLEVAGVVPDRWLCELLEVCRAGDYARLESYVERLTCEAYAVSQLIDQLLRMIVSSEDISDRKKAVICEKIALCQWRVTDGASEYLQLLDLGCSMTEALQ